MAKKVYNGSISKHRKKYLSIYRALRGKGIFEYVYGKIVKLYYIQNG